MVFPGFVLKLFKGNTIVVGKDKGTMWKHLTNASIHIVGEPFRVISRLLIQSSKEIGHLAKYAHYESGIESDPSLIEVAVETKA